MKFKTLLLMSCLIAFVTACSSPEGDFCLSASAIPLSDVSAEILVRNDIDAARAILAHNTYGAIACGWEK